MRQKLKVRLHGAFTWVQDPFSCNYIGYCQEKFDAVAVVDASCERTLKFFRLRFEFGSRKWILRSLLSLRDPYLPSNLDTASRPLKVSVWWTTLFVWSCRSKEFPHKRCFFSSPQCLPTTDRFHSFVLGSSGSRNKDLLEEAAFRICYLDLHNSN